MKALLKIWSAFTSWLGGLFGFGPAGIESKPVEPGKELEAEKAARSVVDRHRNDIIDFAEKWENDQVVLSEYLSRNNPEFFEQALLQVHWPSLVSTYSKGTLDDIKYNGSNLNVGPEVNRMIRDAVDAERAARFGDQKPPATNGMDPETGGQKF